MGSSSGSARGARPQRGRATTRRMAAIDAGARLVTHLFNGMSAARPPRARRRRRRPRRRPRRRVDHRRPRPRPPRGLRAGVPRQAAPSRIVLVTDAVAWRARPGRRHRHPRRRRHGAPPGRRHARRAAPSPSTARSPTSCTAAASTCSTRCSRRRPPPPICVGRSDIGRSPSAPGPTWPHSTRPSPARRPRSMDSRSSTWRDGPRRRSHRHRRSRAVDRYGRAMDIVAAVFIENIELRQAPGPSTRIDLTGVTSRWPRRQPGAGHPRASSGGARPLPPDEPGAERSRPSTHRDGEQVARNVQPLQVEPGKFAYRLVRAELEFDRLRHRRSQRTASTWVPVATVPFTLLATGL